MSVPELKLSAAETEVYDRQIRLWGVESQQRLRAANVLLIGVRGLGSEIAKNILLTGINSLVILDDGIVTEYEQSKNFLINHDGIGSKIAEAVLKRARLLNPLVTVTGDTSDLASKDDDFFKQFTMIVATRIKTDGLFRLDKICRASGVKLIFGDVLGYFGYSVLDFHEHIFQNEVVKVKPKKRTHKGGNTGEDRIVTKEETKIIYPELKRVVILPNTKQSVDHIKKKKRKNVYFFLMLTVLEFRNRHNRDPEEEHMDKDLLILKEIMSEILDLYDVDHNKISDDVFELLFGEVVPVCSVVGGVIAQEVIKGVSLNDVPIHNVFLLDPQTYSGKEESII